LSSEQETLALRHRARSRLPLRLLVLHILNAHHHDRVHLLGFFPSAAPFLLLIERAAEDHRFEQERRSFSVPMIQARKTVETRVSPTISSASVARFFLTSAPSHQIDRYGIMTVENVVVIHANPCQPNADVRKGQPDIDRLKT